MSSSRFEVQRLRRAALAEHEAGFALSRALLSHCAQQMRDRVRPERPLQDADRRPDDWHRFGFPTPSTWKRRPRLQAHQVEELPRAPIARVRHSPRQPVERDAPSLARSRNSAAARSPLRCRHAPSRRSIATPSPRPTVHLPAGRPRAARGWWTCRRRRRRSLRRVVRPAQQLDHPQQVGPCSVASKPMPAHAMAAAIRNPGAVCARQISRIALHMQSGRQRAFCLAVRIRGKTPDRPDGLPFLAHARARRRRA